MVDRVGFGRAARHLLVEDPELLRDRLRLRGVAAQAREAVLRWMERGPAIVLLGAGLLGYVAGQMIFSDPGVVGLLPQMPDWSARAAGIVGALLVVAVGRWLEQRILARQDITLV